MKWFSRSLGTMLIVDGMNAIVRPRAYTRSLEKGIPVVDDILEYFARRPDLTRGLSVAEVLLGAWLTLR